MKQLILIALLMLTPVLHLSFVAVAQETSIADNVVVAQGVALLPDGDLLWRNEQASVAQDESADLPATVAGFGLAMDGTLLLQGQTATERQLLNAPQGGFYQGDGVIAAAIDGAAEVATLSLEPAENGSGAFAVEGGYFDVELWWMELSAGELTWSEQSAFPAAWILVSGDATIDGQAYSAGGEAAAGVLNDGEVISVADGQTAVLAAAVIAGPAPDSAASGAVTLRAWVCDEGITEADLPNEGCEQVVEGFAARLEGEALDEELTLVNAVPLEDGYQWNELPVGGDPVYRVTIDQMPASFGQAWLLVEDGAAEPARIDVSLSSATPEAAVSVYFLPGSGAPASSITAYAYACPDAATPDEACISSEALELPGITFRRVDGSDTLAGDTAEATDDGGLRWTDLAEGEWWLYPADIVLPEGFVIRNVAGNVETTDEGWRVLVNADEAAIVQILLAPEGSEPAAG